MKKLKLIVLILMIGLVSAGVISLSRSISLSRERKAIADEWGVHNYNITEPTDEGGGMFRVCIETKKLYSCGHYNSSVSNKYEWAEEKFKYFIDKEILYRNRVEPDKEVVDVK